MSRLLTYIGRFALILIGYAAAALAASTFLHVVSLGPLGFTAEQAPAVIMGSIVFSIPFVALFVGYFAFMPAVLTILLGELLGARSWLYYALGGAFVATVIIVWFVRAAETGNDAVGDPRYWAAMVGGGVIGGLAYWLVAGRLAGNWWSSEPTSPAPSGS